MNKIAIVGYGWVGKAMEHLFDKQGAYVYDPPAKKGKSKAWVNAADIAFVGVPTPVMGEGKLDTSIVEEVISWCETPLIVIRSTVNPGDCERWTKKYGRHIVMQPEYLGETVAHPLLDEKIRPFLILGGAPEDVRKLIELYTTVYNANVTIRQVTTTEAELIKLSENRAIAYKVAQCQELYDVCEASGINYYTIRDAVYGDDPRFNLWFSMIYPEARGMNSKCIPKDVYAWCAFAESLGYQPEITRAMLERNKKWIK